MNKLFIYGVIMLFAGLIAFHVSNALIVTQKEGLTSPTSSTGTGSSSSASAATSASSTTTPPPVPAGAAPSKTSTKVSACGDDCSAYDEINTLLDQFNAVKKVHKKGDDAFKKVDSDLIKLSKSVKNMGSNKTPGGRPPINKKMLS